METDERIKLLMLRIGRSPFRLSYTSRDVRAVALAVGLSRVYEEQEMNGDGLSRGPGNGTKLYDAFRVFPSGTKGGGPGATGVTGSIVQKKDEAAATKGGAGK